jgi:hypothetical protein
MVEWLTARQAKIDELRRAHAVVGNVGPGSGAGRPPKRGTQQLNEALVLRIVTEFQGFIRDLLDLGTLRIVRGAGALPRYQTQLISAASHDRAINRGNPNMDSIRRDVERLGITQLGAELGKHNMKHSADVATLRELVELRNALAHSDDDRLARLARQGIRPSIGYVEASTRCLRRHARAFDKVLWNYLLSLFPGTDPWSP